MSSKEQYKNTLKYKNQIIANQDLYITKLHKSYQELIIENSKLMSLVNISDIVGLPPVLHKRKKWFQFWK